MRITISLFCLNLLSEIIFLEKIVFLSIGLKFSKVYNRKFWGNINHDAP